MNDGPANLETIEESTPAIEMQREVLRAMVDGIDVEMQRIAIYKRVQDLQFYFVNPVNYSEGVDTVPDYVRWASSEEVADFFELLRGPIKHAKQGSVNSEKYARPWPGFKWPARPRRKSERR